ncbi:hypothetical protein GRJ2_001608400 [Grus japonensis]|uniref:Uncharacterized protein n=1 Tax=Grus japonensis TaxID=30415 RepID=A0ABC9X1H8_GRUJA
MWLCRKPSASLGRRDDCPSACPDNLALIFAGVPELHRKEIGMTKRDCQLWVGQRYKREREEKRREEKRREEKRREEEKKRRREEEKKRRREEEKKRRREEEKKRRREEEEKGREKQDPFALALTKVVLI